MPGHIVTGRWLLESPSRFVEGGGVHCARGRVVRVLGSRDAVRRAQLRVVDLGDVVLAAGFVNAHAHLELTAFAGAIAPGATFTGWIRELLRRKASQSADELSRAARSGADRLLATGTTTVGDIDSMDLTDAALAGHPLRRRVYREMLDAQDSNRTDAAIARATLPRPRRALRLEGLAPHAPYTVSQRLFEELGRQAARARRWSTIHWAETHEEAEWLESGSGPMSALLSGSPRCTGLDAIDRAGLLGPRTSLVHGNHPARGDLERVVRARSVLVHCPGTHAYFGRDPFDFEGAAEAGVTVALGTDGLASNADLDMRREMRLVREGAPELRPELVWNMATRNAALAVGLEGRAGEIVAGAHADLCAHALPGVDLARARPADLLDALTAGRSTVASVWIGGRSVPLSTVVGDTDPVR
jgi:cytosine/adenosine deaminase-related metal-dependent hydrolase